MYLRAMDVDIANFDDLSIEFWKCSDSRVFFVFHFILDTLRKFKVAKGIVRSRKSKKDRQYNEQRKKDKRTKNPS